MRFSIASSATVGALLCGLFSLSACSGDVAVGSSDRQLQTQANGEPTGDGSTCSWAGTTLRPASHCDAVPTPSGYGPYEVGEDFPAPDGCNECSCTERGIMCTVLECNEEGDEAQDPVACTLEAKICPDGSSVGRVGPDCEFAPCPGEEGTTVNEGECSVACTMDAFICPDGSSVGRVAPDCEFASCPDEEPIACTDDARECPDGSFVGRVAPDCEFAACPDEGVSCPADAKLCADGSYVSRTQPNCEFALCPDEEPVACTDDLSECPDGSFVARVAPSCEFAPCPDEGVSCPADAKLCADGSYVSRTQPNCEFAPCPDEGACDGDAMECPDGSFVGRIGPDCEFAPCPYDPCENKACGDACTLCAPDDADCAETAVEKACNAEGTCEAGEPACL